MPNLGLHSSRFSILDLIDLFGLDDLSTSQAIITSEKTSLANFVTAYFGNFAIHATSIESALILLVNPNVFSICFYAKILNCGIVSNPKFWARSFKSSLQTRSNLTFDI
jgi:hypothetical protein